MITRIKINGFKSFQNFEIFFAPFTVVAGTNASGKSNLFDALMLLSRLAEKDLKTAFSEQRGDPTELFTQYDDLYYAREMSFEVDMLVNRTVKDNWGGEATLNNTRLRYKLTIARQSNALGVEDLIVKNESLEKIKGANDKFIKGLPKKAAAYWKTLKAGGSAKPFIETTDQNGVITISTRQDGKRGGKARPAKAITQTVLGGINETDFPHAFAAKEEMKSWKFLQLNPEELREPTKKDIGIKDEITQGGKNLAAALYRIKTADPYSLKEISRKLNSFLPNYTEVNVDDDDANKQFIIKIKGEDGKEFSSRVLSEGTLRLLALCILEHDDRHTGLLCFEEPENGIHPFRMEAMVHLLKELSIDFGQGEGPLRQVIINTHSPVLVSKLLRWGHDDNVSIWLSRVSTFISNENGTKRKLQISRMSPVLKKAKQLSLFQEEIDENELKLTLSEVREYLETADTESAINEIIT
jgi:predicted ATPase